MLYTPPMIIYKGTVGGFLLDVDKGRIAEKIEDAFRRHNIAGGGLSEFRSWNNSLEVMGAVLDRASDVPRDALVAIEYKLPVSSRRVDFILTGLDQNGRENAVIVELKQWDYVALTEKENLVRSIVGHGIRELSHPSYQAYSYKVAIENYNEDVRKERILISSCAFLHNMEERYRSVLGAPCYGGVVAEAPFFLKGDREKLRNYFSRRVAEPDDGRVLELLDNGRIRPSKALQDTLGEMINGNDEFVLLDEQEVVYQNIVHLLSSMTEDGKKHVVIVQGGPGTGKSVLALKLLSHFTRKGERGAYVTKNAAPRNVYKAKLKKGYGYKKSFIDAMFMPSGSFVDEAPNAFDVLLVDEAHRLNRRSGMFQNKGVNQISEIISASRLSVFFLDEGQRIDHRDIGSTEEIRKCAGELGAIVHDGEEFRLISEFRCGGSDAFLSFVEELIGVKPSGSSRLEKGFEGYDVRLFDDPSAMMDLIRRKNREANKARMLAGYCWDWVSDKDPSKNDISLPGGFSAQWNFAGTSTWAIDPDSVEQIGCIHTSQGLEFDYVGVILGPDIVYRDGKVIALPGERARTDKSLSGYKGGSLPQKTAEEIVINTYRTLLTRGQKGCYIYCVDPGMQEWTRSLLESWLGEG